MKHIRLLFILIIACGVFAGCSTTTPVCITSSVSPMSGKTVAENLGKCDGSDTAYSFLGLFMFGRPDLDIAIKNALSQKGGDTLINVRCYETSRYFLLFSTTTAVVEGDAVKFGEPEPVKVTDKKGRAK